MCEPRRAKVLSERKRQEAADCGELLNSFRIMLCRSSYSDVSIGKYLIVTNVDRGVLCLGTGYRPAWSPGLRSTRVQIYRSRSEEHTSELQSPYVISYAV